jgi:hypothetical protein
MELINKQTGTPTQSWIGRVDRRNLPKVDYYSELRSWVQHAILEAEEKKDFNKKDALLSLLKDL